MAPLVLTYINRPLDVNIRVFASTGMAILYYKHIIPLDPYPSCFHIFTISKHSLIFLPTKFWYIFHEGPHICHQNILFSFISEIANGGSFSLLLIPYLFRQIL